ncbi:MAG: DUF111 family protein, partial [Elusimicrobia bacterium]|nr:DUF111 family protein [Elusimicrobiota bacterium]MBD3411892.1 DUF111 family protein [Elusimicrobiota bacterium]
MNVLYINMSAGISGDMFLGALINAGLPVPFVQKTVRKLGFKKTRVIVTSSERHHLPGVSVRFTKDRSQTPAAMKRSIDQSGLNPMVKKRAHLMVSYLINAEASAHGKKPGQVHFHQLSEPDTLID